MLEHYDTLEGRTRHEIEKIKGSRFLATSFGVGSAERVAACIEEVRAELPDARHHCWAWRLGPGGERWRYSDDGEPSGSAGRPILQQLEGAGLTDALVVVTRYFGGTKLGVGGLVRAYGAAAREVLARASVRTVQVTRAFRVELPYECDGPVRGLLAGLDLRAEDEAFGADVRLTVRVPLKDAEGFLAELGERTAGRASVRELTEP